MTTQQSGRVIGTNVFAPNLFTVEGEATTGLSGVNIVIGDINAPNSWNVPWDKMNPDLINVENYKRNQELLIRAVRNFIRKNNFSELDEKLENEEITIEEYEAELDANLQKYAITLKDIDFPSDIYNVIDLVEKIGIDLKSFSLSEVSEMFSIREDQLVGHINFSHNQIK